MLWTPLGARRLYWWWDAICPVCHLAPSYSYAIHTVSPPRPLIPVSRGGVQTEEQTGGQVASLFRACSTRSAWRSTSHLLNLQQCCQKEVANEWAMCESGILIWFRDNTVTTKTQKEPQDESRIRPQKACCTVVQCYKLDSLKRIFSEMPPLQHYLSVMCYIF